MNKRFKMSVAVSMCYSTNFMQLEAFAVSQNCSWLAYTASADEPASQHTRDSIIPTNHRLETES